MIIDAALTCRGESSDFVRVLSPHKMGPNEEAEALQVVGFQDRRVIGRDQEDISRCTPRPREGTMWLLILEVEKQ